MRTRMKLTFALAAVLSFGVAQAQNLNLPKVEDLMSSDTFHATGLDKLTPTELAALNQWLGAYAQAVLDTYGPTPTTGAASTPDVIESRIDGAFEGWDGETIFRLMNGQVWQQASYSYVYHYAYSPQVTIYQSSGGYVMKVEGVDQTIGVTRIK